MFGRNGQLLSRLEFHLLEPRLGYDIAGEGEVSRGKRIRAPCEHIPCTNTGQCWARRQPPYGLPKFQVTQDNATTVL